MLRKINILIIAYYYPPDNNGGIKRPLAFYKGLIDAGHNVKVITHGQNNNNKNDNIIRVKDGFSSQADKTVIGYIFKILTQIYINIGGKSTYYLYWKIKSILKIKELMRTEPINLIIASYPPVECLEIGLFFARKYGIRLIADYRDPLVDESSEALTIKRYPQMLSYFQKLDKSIIDNAENIIVIAPSMQDYYRNKGIGNKVHLIPNGYDSVLKKHNYIKNNSLNKFTLVYTGTLSHYDKERDLSEFFQAINIGLKSDNIIFSKLRVLLFGKINETDINGAADLVRAGIVNICGEVESSEVDEIQKNADGLILLTGIERRCVATGKIFEYMVSGSPIFGLTKNTFAEVIISSTGIGVTVSPRDVNQIYRELKKILMHGLIDRKLNFIEIEKYSRYNQINELNKILCNEN